MPYFVAEIAGEAGTGLTCVDEQALRGECMRSHGVAWIESYIGTQVDRRICFFEAPDAESVRVALRSIRARFDRVWPAVRLRASEASSAD
ncbi:MAG: DUF4242 domain-containing protein [Polyangiaceae bacterium]|nr:DUF4242 domain-containing protein [Polyangiaceae bacterium]